MCRTHILLSQSELEVILHFNSLQLQFELGNVWRGGYDVVSDGRSISTGAEVDHDFVVSNGRSISTIWSSRSDDIEVGELCGDDLKDRRSWVFESHLLHNRDTLN